MRRRPEEVTRAEACVSLDKGTINMKALTRQRVELELINDKGVTSFVNIAFFDPKFLVSGDKFLSSSWNKESTFHIRDSSPAFREERQVLGSQINHPASGCP